MEESQGKGRRTETQLLFHLGSRQGRLKLSPPRTPAGDLLPLPSLGDATDILHFPPLDHSEPDRLLKPPQIKDPAEVERVDLLVLGVQVDVVGRDGREDGRVWERVGREVEQVRQVEEVHGAEDLVVESREGEGGDVALVGPQAVCRQQSRHLSEW